MFNSQSNFHLLLLFLLIVSVSSVARAPTPFCSSKPIYKQVPITVGEIIDADVSSMFQGYNLNVTTAVDYPFASVSRKWNVLDRVNTYFPNVISHYIEPKDNSVGRDSFLLYKDNGGTIWLNYGIIRSKDRLPETSSSVIVSSDKNVICFDAALFLDHGLAVVDCVKTGQSFFSKYTNYWFIIDLTNSGKKTL